MVREPIVVRVRHLSVRKWIDSLKEFAGDKDVVTSSITVLGEDHIPAANQRVDDGHRAKRYRMEKQLTEGRKRWSYQGSNFDSSAFRIALSLHSKNICTVSQLTVSDNLSLWVDTFIQLQYPSGGFQISSC